MKRSFNEFAAGTQTPKREDFAPIKRVKEDPAPVSLRTMPPWSSSLPSFVYDTNKQEKLDNQVKYGPKATLGKQDLSRLTRHFGEDVGKRFTQYSSTRKDYVTAAENANRPLTLQEQDVKAKRDPGWTSINHVIASGTGQNMLNRMTLQFLDGKEAVRNETITNATAALDVSNGPVQLAGSMMQRSGARKELLKSLAMQAAAVGRMTGVGREILKEESAEQGYGKSTQGELGHAGKRKAMMKDVLTTFQGDSTAGRIGAYKSFMKNTFDSTGNLRLGHGSPNGRVSTGFDMPLDGDRKPTQRGLRLLDTHKTFGMPNMLDSGQRGSGIFTTTVKGNLLSSSREK